jgi:hypothetical protein
MWYVLGGLILLFVLFILWRLSSVGRGRRQRNERILKLLDPLGQKLDAGEPVSVEEVREFARRPETRHMLFTILREMNRSDLLPDDFNAPIQQAEAALVFWMMHPNELQDPPETMEHLQDVRHTVNGRDATIHVFRYRMPADHWAGKDGWLLGLAGPVDAEAEPYSELPAAFSRCGDKEGDITPEDLVAWYVGLMKQKSAFS